MKRAPKFKVYGSKTAFAVPVGLSDTMAATAWFWNHKGTEGYKLAVEYCAWKNRRKAK